MAYLKNILSLLLGRGRSRGRPRGSTNRDTIPAVTSGPMDRFVPRPTRVSTAVDAAALVSGVTVPMPSSSPAPPPPPVDAAGASGARMVAAGPSGSVAAPLRGR